MEEENGLREYQMQLQEEKRQAERERKDRIAEQQAVDGYNEVKDKFVQQHTAIYDSFGVRWVECEICDEIKSVDDFTSYGGVGHQNLGRCKECSRKEREREQSKKTIK